MDYAIIKAAGKQYKVTAGLILDIDKIEGEKGAEVSFPDVLLVGVDKSTQVGTPIVIGANVKATIIVQIKGDKVRVAKFKAKARFRRTTGFRAQLTKIQIVDIKGGKA